MAEGIRLLETLVLNGPNYWSYRPCVWMRIDLGPFRDRPSIDIPGFADELVKLLPGLEEHHCSEGERGGFLKRLREGTWLGHVAEHVAIEIQQEVGISVTFGRTRETKTPGVYNLVYEMEEERAGIRAGKLALDVVEHCAGLDVDLDLPSSIERLKKTRDRWALGPSTRSIVAAATARGIPHLRLNDRSLVMLGTGVHQKRIQATIASTTGQLGVEIAGDKSLTKKLLGDNGVPVPKGTVVDDEDEAVDAAKALGWPVVVKPLDASHGRGVLTNIRSEAELRLAFKDAVKFRDEVIVEHFLEGFDFRFLVINGRFICAAQRVPAFVVGDGRRTIDELVDVVNEDPRRGIGHEKILTKIEIDELSLALLSRRGLTPQSVPDEGETVYLKSTANLSTGGISRDVTDSVHPSNIHLMERIARIVGLDIAGIDVISPTVEKPVGDVGGGIVEVNAAPGFRMHTDPTEGTPRDAAGAVMDMLYPPGAPSRIPIVSITGTNGKTTTTRLLAHVARYAGHHVGLTTTEGVYVGSEQIMKGDCTGPASAQAVLRDPTVTFAALETARGGLLRFGLGYDWANVGVVTNVAEDHLGLRDIETLEDLARLKALVVERVFPDGVAVLNAEDPMSDWIAGRVKARIAYFSLDPHHSRLKEHVAAGGLAAVMDRHDTLCLYRATLRIPPGADHLRRQGPLQHLQRARGLPRRVRRRHRAGRHSRRPDDVPPDAVPGAGARERVRVPRLQGDDRLLPQRARHGARGAVPRLDQTRPAGRDPQRARGPARSGLRRDREGGGAALRPRDPPRRRRPAGTPGRRSRREAARRPGPPRDEGGRDRGGQERIRGRPPGAPDRAPRRPRRRLRRPDLEGRRADRLRAPEGVPAPGP
jgi:cyanophycin synthetase